MNLIKKSKQDYDIILKGKVVGEVNFFIEDQSMFLNTLVIYDTFKDEDLGMQVVEYLIKEYSVDIYVGEAMVAIGY